MLFCIFFFFKQKTAYEMRISDWSSDVCSSDLCTDPFFGSAVDLHGGLVLAAEASTVGVALPHRGNSPAIAAFRVVPIDGLADPRGRRLVEGGDRKSVVSGKSVSVRVDLGGRRHIKTKNELKHLQSNDRN